MARIRGSTVVARRVEDVFDFVADERNEPKYNPRMVRVDKLTPGPIATGTRWSATLAARRPIDIRLEVTDYRRPYRLATTTRTTGAQISGAVTFEPDPAGTRLSWSWQLRPKGVLRLIAPVFAVVGRRQEAANWAALKRHLENGPG
jgi:hypothetical protein